MDSSTWMIAVVALMALVFYKILRGYRSPRMLREAATAVGSGAAVVDVRTREEFSRGHHPGALNIPVQELSGVTAKLGDTERPVIVYCHSGNRSGLAAKILRDAGFSAIFDIGPYRNTRALPEPVVASRSRIPSKRRRRR